MTQDRHTQSKAAQASGAKDDTSGLFGAPIFSDPGVRALKRIGVIDVGSNSVRLVVFDGAARSPAYFFNEKILCGLGAGLAETGKLNPEGRARALMALKRFKVLADGLEVTSLSAVATAAVRDAKDGPAFRTEVQKETGLRLWVIDGEEEARLSAQGVLLGWPDASGIMCDIGGSSVELATLDNGQVGPRASSAIGPLKLSSVKGGRKGRRKAIDAGLEKLVAKMPEPGDRLFLVGGSWRAIARIDMERRGYPLKVLHEYRIKKRDVQATLKFIQKADLEALRLTCGISGARMALVPLAAEVLARLIKHLSPKEIVVSSYGIREGLLYEHMPKRLRDRDPLIEACRFYENKDARLPGFGRTLYHFIKPLFPRASKARLRLIKAACLLHDVNWRAHPDYRADVCFDTATRANLAGLKHHERIFLGLALMHRYRNRNIGSRFEAVAPLLSERDTQEAEVLGR
ncbi:MAG: Ppx/GppA family phosphatase, partial [Pseudomonadota bacterium]